MEETIEVVTPSTCKMIEKLDRFFKRRVIDI